MDPFSFKVGIWCVGFRLETQIDAPSGGSIPWGPERKNSPLPFTQ